MKRRERSTEVNLHNTKTAFTKPQLAAISSKLLNDPKITFEIDGWKVKGNIICEAKVNAYIEYEAVCLKTGKKYKDRGIVIPQNDQIVLAYGPLQIVLKTDDIISRKIVNRQTHIVYELHDMPYNSGFNKWSGKVTLVLSGDVLNVKQDNSKFSIQKFVNSYLSKDVFERLTEIYMDDQVLCLEVMKHEPCKFVWRLNQYLLNDISPIEDVICQDLMRYCRENSVMMPEFINVKIA